MRSCLALVVLAALGAQAQPLGIPRWQRSVTGMVGLPPANASAHELERLERYLYFGVPYCGGLAASAYAANLAVARSMGAYLAAVNTSATDPQARIVALRLATAFSAFPCAYPGRQLPVIAAPPPQPGDPPFALKAPDLGKVEDKDQETAADLLVRYDTDAARCATTWKNGETLRLSLVAKGMTLNTQTATGMGRFQLLFEQAAAALRDHNWDEALSNLQAAEGTQQKVAATVGH